MPEGTDSPRAAVFFDRDNTLIVGSEYLGDPKQVKLMSDAAEAVAGARHMGFTTVTISNQSGVARGFFTENDVKAVNRKLDALLLERHPGAVIDRHEFCPHHPTHGVAPYRQACQCRKPRDGMIRRAASAMKLDLGQSWLIGDAPRDIEAGAAAGLRTILLRVDGVTPSPAASAPTKVQPDFEAESLREALWIIANETGRQLPVMGREGAELDELEDTPPHMGLEEDESFPAGIGRGEEEMLPGEEEETFSSEERSGGQRAAEGRDLAATLTAPPPPNPRAPARPPAAPERSTNLSTDMSEPGHLPSGAASEAAYASHAAQASHAPQSSRSPGLGPTPTGEPATSDRIAATTAQILDDLRRQRETPREDFNFLRLLAGVVQVLAAAAVVWAVIEQFDVGRMLLAVFLQVLTLTLVSASSR